VSGQLAEAAWLFLPLVGSFVAHAPVLKFDWMRPLNRPIDGGRVLRGRRLLGDHKTWRGAIVMSAGTAAATLVLSRWPWYWSRLPDAVQAAGPLSLAALMGLGIVLAELPTSFLKRRLDVAPGQRLRSPAGVLLSIYDQGDFVPGIWLALLPIWVMPLKQAAVSFVIVSAVHLGISVIGYAMGARRTIL
jgi:hypothetical protein